MLEQRGPASNLGWLIRASIRRPGKFISVLRGNYRDRFLKNSLEKKFIGKNVEYSIPPYTRSDIKDEVIFDLEQKGVKIINYALNKEDFEEFFSDANYLQYKYYYDGGGCGTLFYNLPILNKLCHRPVQNNALSILSSLFWAIFQPSIFLSAANPDSELLLWWYCSR